MRGLDKFRKGIAHFEALLLVLGICLFVYLIRYTITIGMENKYQTDSGQCYYDAIYESWLKI